MMEIDVAADLEAVTTQIENGLDELQKLDAQRQELAQQIQNLNGVAMYLRGKEKSTETPFTAGDTEAETNTEET